MASDKLSQQVFEETIKPLIQTLEDTKRKIKRFGDVLNNVKISAKMNDKRIPPLNMN